MNPEALERAYEWYTSGPRQRLTAWWKDRSGYDTLVVEGSHWSVDRGSKRTVKSDQWEMIQFPAIST